MCSVSPRGRFMKVHAIADVADVPGTHFVDPARIVSVSIYYKTSESKKEHLADEIELVVLYYASNESIIRSFKLTADEYQRVLPELEALPWWGRHDSQ